MLQFTSRQARIHNLLLVLTVAQLVTITHAGLRQGDPERGVIVETVAPSSDGEKSGIRPGDVLISWTRAATSPANPVEAREESRASFDLMAVETEQRPRGSVTFH